MCYGKSVRCTVSNKATYVLCQVGQVHSLERDKVYALWQVGLVHSLEQDNVSVLC